MKEMPYEEWTLCNCGDDDYGPHYLQMGGTQVRYADDIALFKQISDTQAAAEYWRAEMDRHSLGDGYPIEHWGGELDSGMASEEIAFPRFDAIRRFATHPHARETSYE